MTVNLRILNCLLYRYFWRPVVNILVLVLCIFFPRTRDLLVSQKTTQRHFLSTLHPLSPVIFATAFVLLRNSRFNFHCYTQHNAYSEIGPEVTLPPLAISCAKDYKGYSLVQTSFTEPPNNNRIYYQRYMHSDY